MIILGGGGMLGHRLWLELGKVLPDLTVTVRQDRQAYSGFGELIRTGNIIDHIDVSNFESLGKVLESVRPKWIINCVAVTKRKEDHHHFSSEIKLNSLLPHVLAEWAENHDAKVIHFSTDCVFDGKTGNYREDSPVNAQDMYGRSKALGEIKGPSALTIRTSFIGRELYSGTELIEWMLRQRGKKISGYKNAMYSGVTTAQAARVVKHVILDHPKLSGLWQVASDPISKFDLLNLVNDRFKLGAQIDPDEKYHCYRQLDGTRFAKETGIITPSWSDMITEMAKDEIPYDHWRKEI